MAHPLPLAPHHVEEGHHTTPLSHLGHDNLVHGAQATLGCENQRAIWNRCRFQGPYHALWIEGHRPKSRIHDREYGVYTGQGPATLRNLVPNAEGKPAGDLVGGHVTQIPQDKRLLIGLKCIERRS